jgi:hypothetical protein
LTFAGLTFGVLECSDQPSPVAFNEDHGRDFFKHIDLFSHRSGVASDIPIGVNQCHIWSRKPNLYVCWRLHHASQLALKKPCVLPDVLLHTLPMSSANVDVIAVFGEDTRERFRVVLVPGISIRIERFSHASLIVWAILIRETCKGRSKNENHDQTQLGYGCHGSSLSFKR